jgi:hypothetical protein
MNEDDDDTDVVEQKDEPDHEPVVMAESASETQLINMPGPVWLSYQLTMAQALSQAEIPIHLLKAAHASLSRFIGLTDDYCGLIGARLKTVPLDNQQNQV